MAQTATRRRKGDTPKSSRRSGSGKPRRGASRAVAKSAAKTAVSDGPSGLGKITRSMARKAVKEVASRALESGARAVRAVAERTGASGKRALEAGMSRRLPIQRSIDVAVPLRVAWKEWMAFTSLPEGVHRIEDIERHGEGLAGQIAGPRSGDWAAEVLDEREEQSFAWHSVEGSDCAGLVTFHELSDRLTRIELNLDVVPTSIAEAVTLSTHLADRRAQTDLRRLKTRLELINPDTYKNDARQDNGKPKQDDDKPKQDDAN